MDRYKIIIISNSNNFFIKKKILLYLEESLDVVYPGDKKILSNYCQIF